jgi:RNA polymerase-binding transcription factor DksA
VTVNVPDPAGEASSDSSRAPRAALDAARKEAVGRLAALTGGFEELVAASRDSNADDEHDPEGATIAFERSQLDSLVVRTRAQLAEIDAAERRLADGRYGRCEACGRPIAPARLEALPATRTCIACATAGARRRPR